MGRCMKNRAGNSHLPFRRRERAMLPFRQMRSLQKFAAVHASVCNQFNSERSFYSRPDFNRNGAAALAKWRQLGAAQGSAILLLVGPVRNRLTGPIGDSRTFFPGGWSSKKIARAMRYEKMRRKPSAASGSPCHGRALQRVLEHLATLHDEAEVPIWVSDEAEVLCRISINEQHIGMRPLDHHAQCSGVRVAGA